MSSFKPISVKTRNITKKIMGNKNILLGKIITNWQNIVGTEISSKCSPIKITFSKNKNEENGNIVVNLGVTSSNSTEIDYKSSLIIDKINSYLGYNAVKAIKLIHNPKSNKKSPIVPKSKPITDNEKKEIQAITSNVEDEDLQKALNKLGNAIISRQAPK